MAQSTPNLGLIKPDVSDRYTPNVFNENLEKADRHLGLLGSHLINGSRSTNLSEFVGGTDGMTITSVVARREGRLGYVSISFKNDNPIATTANGRLTGTAPFLVGTVIPQMRPISPVGMQSSNVGYYSTSGLLDPDGNIWLSHVATTGGNTAIAAENAFQLITTWYILKGNL